MQNAAPTADSTIGDGGDDSPALKVAVGRLSVGKTHVCALSVTGAAYCWGDNRWGQVHPEFVPNPVLAPTAVATEHSFHSIHAGDAFTCGLTVRAEVVCWGYNEGKQSNPMLENSPVLSAGFTGLGPVTQLRVGGAHTCALEDTGVMKCWGSNMHGETGNNGLGALGQGDLSAHQLVQVTLAQ